MLFCQRIAVCFLCLMPLLAVGCGSDETAEQTAEQEELFESTDYEAQMMGNAPEEE